MPRSTSRRVGAVGLGALLASGVAACGSSGPAGSGHPTANAIEAAYTTTMSAKTARFSFTETVSVHSTSGSRQLTVTGNGEMDEATQAFAATISVPNAGSFHLVETGGDLYVELPPAARAAVPAHTPWLEVNLNKVDEAKMGRSFSSLAAAGNSNPAQALSQLASVSDQVTKVGTATVDGVPTTEYRAEVSLAKVAAQARAKGGAKVAQAVEREEQALHSSTLPVEVWIDAKHQVRRLSTSIPFPASSTVSGSADLTMTLSGYGSPVQVAAPPASQVTNITAQAMQAPA